MSTAESRMKKVSVFGFLVIAFRRNPDAIEDVHQRGLVPDDEMKLAEFGKAIRPDADRDVLAASAHRRHRRLYEKLVVPNRRGHPHFDRR